MAALMAILLGRVPAEELPLVKTGADELITWCGADCLNTSEGATLRGGVRGSTPLEFNISVR